MVLIISDEIDQTTNIVIDWLISTGVKSLRINSNTFFESINIEIVSNDNIHIELCNIVGDKISLDNIKSFWYRKGDLNYDFSLFSDNIKNGLKKGTLNHLINEWVTLKEFIIQNLSKKDRHIGDFFEKYTNKLDYLCLASECGFLIPHTYICNSKENIFNILERNKKKRFITKSIQDIFNLVYDNKSIYTYTSEVTKDDIKKLPDLFFPSLLQEKIDKKFELRIFFLNEQIFPMAIFSQLDEMTKIDYRNYNIKKPNRCVPYSLSATLKKQLEGFIEKSKLNTGSIDIIVTKSDEFYFLEVNPSGQFGDLSYNCNYNIEKKIANYLSHGK